MSAYIIYIYVCPINKSMESVFVPQGTATMKMRRINIEQYAAGKDKSMSQSVGCTCSVNVVQVYTDINYTRRVVYDT